MTVSGPTTDPGWYPDAHAPGVLRWYDGTTWTEHTRSSATGPHDGTSYGGNAYGYGPQGAGERDALHWVVPVGRRGWAIAAGYAGIVGALCWVLAPVALAMGVWALVDLGRHDGLGKGRAWFAVAVGVVGSLLLALFVITVVVGP